MPRYWSLEEARAILPEAVRLLGELRQTLREYAEQQRAGERSPGPAPATRTPSVNGHGRATTPLPAEQRSRNPLAWFERQGIQVKDIEAGLIDFPCLRSDGEEVLLCYRLGEPGIEFWHDLQSGFAGRRPIDEL